MATIGTKKNSPSSLIKPLPNGGFGPLPGENPFNSISQPSTTTATYTTAADLVPKYEGIIKAPTPINYENIPTQGLDVAPTIALPERPELARGMGESYYQAERGRRQDALRNEFFGSGGVLSQQASDASARGIADSGVGKKLLERTVTNPFAQAFIANERDVEQLRQQDLARVEELNARTLSDYAGRVLQAQGFNLESQNKVKDRLSNIAMQNSGNALQAAIAKNQAEMEVTKLSNLLASEDAKNLNDFQLRAIENEIESWKVAGALYNEAERNRLMGIEIAQKPNAK